MKRNYLLALCFMLGILSVWGQEKIQSSFWGCSFGTSQERLLSALESDSLHPMQMEQGLLLKDAESEGFNLIAVLKSSKASSFFSTLVFKFPLL